MTIQILGSGCPNCQTLASNAKEATARARLDAEVVKITDSDTITEMGVLMTPALAVDGTVMRAGKVLSVEEIVELLQGR